MKKLLIISIFLCVLIANFAVNLYDSPVEMEYRSTYTPQRHPPINYREYNQQL